MKYGYRTDLEKLNILQNFLPQFEENHSAESSTPDVPNSVDLKAALGQLRLSDIRQDSCLTDEQKAAMFGVRADSTKSASPRSKGKDVHVSHRTAKLEFTCNLSFFFYDEKKLLVEKHFVLTSCLLSVFCIIGNIHLCLQLNCILHILNLQR